MTGLMLDGKPVVLVFLNDGHVKPDHEGTFLCQTTSHPKRLRELEFKGGYWVDPWCGAGVLRWAELPELPE